MYFEKNKPVFDIDQKRATRWTVVHVYSAERLTYTDLRDNSPSIKPPLERRAVGVCINYGRSDLDVWTIRTWRDDFLKAATCLAGNFTGLPEPLDFFRIHNNDRPFPENLRAQDPFLVYTYSGFKPLRSLPTEVSWKKNFSAAQKLGRIHSYLRDLGYTLKALHAKKIVIRQLPVGSIWYLPSCRRHCIGGFMSLHPMGASDFHNNIPCLHLNHDFCAPECYSPKGELTAATDINALARSLVHYTGGQLTPVLDIDQVVDGMQSRLKIGLPPEIKRFLSVALQPDPKRRYKAISEAMATISGYDQSEHAKRTSHPRGNPKPQRKGRFF